MKIAIIGSRTGFRYEDILDWYNQFEGDIELIIHGGAPGVDMFAEALARDLNINSEIIRPINPSNKLDYLFRNVEIITKADLIVAFWNGTSKGTKFVIDYAKNRKKEVVVILSE